MDEDDIIGLIQGCKTLKYIFHGVFAANNFFSKLYFFFIHKTNTQ